MTNEQKQEIYDKCLAAPSDDDAFWLFVNTASDLCKSGPAGIGPVLDRMMEQLFTKEGSLRRDVKFEPEYKTGE